MVKFKKNILYGICCGLVLSVSLPLNANPTPKAREEAINSFGMKPSQEELIKWHGNSENRTTTHDPQYYGTVNKIKLMLNFFLFDSKEEFHEQQKTLSCDA